MALFVLATPIGNLEDLSPRGRRLLSEAELLLCEDTRHTRRLLSALDIPAPETWACHAHNEERVVPGVIERLEGGATVVLVSDAGTPGISDPGGMVVAAALARGLEVRGVAGPSAVATALSVAGFPASPSRFAGFPPRKAGALRRFAQDLASRPETQVILESARRGDALLEVLAQEMPEREACICRELTKLHEEVRRGPLATLRMSDERGELVLVLGPGTESAASPATVDLAEDAGLKQIAQACAARWGVTRREAYQRLLALEKQPAQGAGSD